MGICWSFCASKSSPVPPSESPAQPPAAEPIPDPDTVSGSDAGVANLIDEDISFLSSNFSHVSWSSLVTSVTTKLSKVAGAVAAFWGDDTAENIFKNINKIKIAEHNEFSAAIQDENLPRGGTATCTKLKAFTIAELKVATRNFRPYSLVGSGGFGSVYKGWMEDNVPSRPTGKPTIAVKKLDVNSKQGFRQWRTEVGFLARLSHPNIVKLMGYCKEDENLLIVYEFMQNGSLNNHLFRYAIEPLSWEARVKIMIGMARGLAYLHTMEKPIIFRDFKSSNVLLDESFVPKISDFGLAKWGPNAGNSCVEGRVMGTIGYAAPEYVMTGKLFVKSDVYSFGVVLLEMLTRMRAFDRTRESGKHHLVDWVKPYLFQRVRVRQIMDPRLDGKYSGKEASEIAKLAVRCLQGEPHRRPSMKEVAETLEKIGARYTNPDAQILLNSS